MPVRAAALLLALAIPAAAGVPLRWTVETSTDPQPYVRRVFRGETVELSATLLSYGSALTSISNATATFYWQTNGMDTAWWTTNAAVSTNVLTATWTPSMDPGASDIIWYIGASNAVGRVYRANGRFRMIGSPGDSAGGPMPAPTAIWDARYDLAGTAAAAQVAAIAAAADSAAALYQPAGDYLTEIPAEVTAGAAAGLTAVQPTNLGTASVGYAASAGFADVVTGVQSGQVADAYAHSQTEHMITYEGGFSAGANAYATYGAAIGWRAAASSGGAIGEGAIAGEGFSAGANAWTTADGTASGAPIDAIQLGTGANQSARSLQVYDYLLLEADGTIPPERVPYAPDHATVSNIAVTAAETVAQTAPEWIALTNLSATITLTNQYERPISLYSTGTVTVAFAGLRPPQALYCVIRGPDALTFPGAHLVGGGSWQTNQANHFLVWSLGTNLMVHPVTTTPED